MKRPKLIIYTSRCYLIINRANLLNLLFQSLQTCIKVSSNINSKCNIEWLSVIIIIIIISTVYQKQKDAAPKDIGLINNWILVYLRFLL